MCSIVFLLHLFFATISLVVTIITLMGQKMVMRGNNDERVKIPPDGVLLAPTTENFSIIMEIKHVHTSNHNPPSISSGLGVTRNYIPLKMTFHTG